MNVKLGTFIFSSNYYNKILQRHRENICTCRTLQVYFYNAKINIDQQSAKDNPGWSLLAITELSSYQSTCNILL